MRVQAIGLAVGFSALLAGQAGQAAPTAATGSNPWLHVRVEEPGRQSKVAVNLPMSVVSVALAAAPEHVFSEGRVKLGHEGKDMSVSDLRRAWAELKATGDAEFATVEDEDQKVRVARAGDLVLIHVEKPSGRESVRVNGSPLSLECSEIVCQHLSRNVRRTP